MSNRDKVIEVINHYQDSLNRYVSRGEEHKILHCLNKLRILPITVSHLEETGVGRTVNSLRKVDGDVGEGARTLVNQWKEMVEQDTHDNDDQESDKGLDDMEECTENENISSQNDMETINVNSNIENKYSSSSEKEHTSEINGGSSTKSNRHKEKDKHDKKYNESSNNEKHENTSNIGHKRSSKSSKRKHEESHAKTVEENSENSEDSDDRRKRKNGKYDKTYKHTSPVRSENKHNKDKTSTKKSDRSKEKRKESRHKSNKHRDKELAMDSPKIKENNPTYKKESTKVKYKEKEKSDDKKESSSSKSSNKEETRKNDTDDKRKERGETSKKDKNRDSKSNIKTASKSLVIKKDMLKSEDCIDSGSGASFAEALGMLEPLPTIKSAKKKLTNNKSDVKKSTRLNTNEEASTSNSNKKSTNQKLKQKDALQEDPNFLLSVRQDDYDLSDENDFDDNMDLNGVPLLLSNPLKLDPLEINISSLLPAITPNYRPVPNNPFLNENPRHKSLTEYENLSNVIASKNARTKVYSGNKVAFGKIPSLFELCTRILMDNIDAIEYTGGIPYMILKPVLEKCSPEQLLNFEHFNAYVIEDTDDLWNFHCQREFRNKKREEWESWREMYIRCLDEREAKLRALTANIKQSQDKSLPVRQTKLAYVDSVAKPPRGVARKQLKNGYTPESKSPLITPSSRLSAIAQSGSVGHVSVPNPGPRAAIGASSNSIIKIKKAPLMQKTLQLMKGRFRR